MGEYNFRFVRQLLDEAALLANTAVSSSKARREEDIHRINQWMLKCDGYLSDNSNAMFAASLEHLKGQLIVKLDALTNYKDED